MHGTQKQYSLQRGGGEEATEVEAAGAGGTIWPSPLGLLHRRQQEDQMVPKCAPGGKAIRVDGISNCDLVEVECTCEQQLCSACSSQAHSPCTCAMWDHWSRKYEAESESIALIRDNTKECPHRKNWRIRYDEIQMLATFLVSQLALVFSIFFVLCSFLCLSLAISCKRTILRT